MPSKIIIYQSKYVPYSVSKDLADKCIAFAFPGKFIGSGDTMEEALQMSRMRFRNQRKKFFIKHPDATNTDWENYAIERQKKISIIHDKFGIKEDFTWCEVNVGKQT